MLLIWYCFWREAPFKAPFMCVVFGHWFSLIIQYLWLSRSWKGTSIFKSTSGILLAWHNSNFHWLFIQDKCKIVGVWRGRVGVTESYILWALLMIKLSRLLHKFFDRAVALPWYRTLNVSCISTENRPCTCVREPWKQKAVVGMAVLTLPPLWGH